MPSEAIAQSASGEGPKGKKLTAESEALQGPKRAESGILEEGVAG
jgi:hypothetical protein